MATSKIVLTCTVGSKICATNNISNCYAYWYSEYHQDSGCGKYGVRLESEKFKTKDGWISQRELRCPSCIKDFPSKRKK